MGVLLTDVRFDSKKYSPLVYEDIPELKEGSIAYDDFWDEQDDRCINGYKPHGMPRITGEHYFYLNMNQISLLPLGEKRKKAGNPFYRELDRMLTMEAEDAKKNEHGLIIGKPRRVGLSWFGAMQVVYELIFYMENEVGICAGKQDKADDFYAKVLYLLSHIREEYRSSVMVKNEERLKLGYSYRENKQEKEIGLKSVMHIKTMFADSSAFEGKQLALAIFEEAGLFENLIASYKATEPCFKEGAIQYGIPLIYGTGGEIEKGSKGYKDMWDNHSVYNLKKVFISASDYYPGDGVPDKKTGESITFFDFRTGKTNKEAAEKYILDERKRVSKSKEGYIKHIQSYPLNESEIFLKSKGGVLDRNKINTQMIRMSEGDDIPVKVMTGRLEWVDSHETKQMLVRAKNRKEKAKIRIKRGSRVKFVEDKYGTVVKCLDPINKKGMQYMPDIGGVDSYDDEIDFEEGKQSFGASIIYRCFHSSSNLGDMPVAYVKERGDSSSDDTFYENTLKLAVFYNCRMLIEYSKTAILTYFTDIDAHDYLKERLDLEAVIGPSKASNEFGQRMNTKEKRLVTRLLKSEVAENIYNYYFNEILVELVDYGDVNTDLAMALGMALMYKLEMFPDITEGIDEDDDYDDDPLMSMTYYAVENGNLVIKSYGNDDFISDGIQTFNPKKDLSREEYKQYRDKKQEYQDELDSRTKALEEKYGGKDIMSYILED